MEEEGNFKLSLLDVCSFSSFSPENKNVDDPQSEMVW